jgi:hypothetical protein
MTLQALRIRLMSECSPQPKFYQTGGDPTGMME